MPRRTAAQRAAHDMDVRRAIEVLQRAFDRYGARVATITDHRNRVGDVHWIRTLIITSDESDPEITDVSHYVARILDEPANARGHRGVRVGGGGTDMGYDLVYRLSRAMYGNNVYGRDGGRIIRHQRL